jgi:hypothetical protein
VCRVKWLAPKVEPTFPQVEGADLWCRRHVARVSPPFTRLAIELANEQIGGVRNPNRRRKKRLPDLQVERRWSNRIQWPERFGKLFGKISDKELARRSGFSLFAVREERRRRGIAPFKPARIEYGWTPKMIALLGTDFDGEIGARLRIPRTAVLRKRTSLGIPPYVAGGVAHDWTPREIALLGEHSDQKIADLLGLCVPTVSVPA